MRSAPRPCGHDPGWVRAREPLTFVRSIELPGVEGRIDHLAFDPATQRLYVAALGNNTVEVVDAKGGAHLKSLRGFREPQGIAIAGDFEAVAVANGQGEGLQMIGGRGLPRWRDGSPGRRFGQRSIRRGGRSGCTWDSEAEPSPRSTRRPAECSDR